MPMARNDESLVGQPCQAVVPVLDRRGRPTELDRLCGEPSWFRYRGPPPSDPRRGKGRTELLMCLEHVKAIGDEIFAWTTKDTDTQRARPIDLERLDMTVFRMHCKACLAFTRVLWDTAAPVGPNPGEMQFCPRCGAKAYYQLNHEADYWEVLSGILDNMPVLLVQMLYSSWDRGRYHKFVDYVAAEVANFDETGGLLDDDAETETETEGD